MRKLSKETIEKIRQSQIGRKFTPEHREKLRLAHLGKPLSFSHKANVVKKLRQNAIKKGQSFEEAFGIEVAKALKQKMRLAKLGLKMPWNSIPERRGELAPRWIKDRTKIKRQEERGGRLHKEWSKSVKNRDKWKCKMLNGECSGKLIAHHILPWKDYPELRYDINNGITLCHAHHPRRREEEKRLIPFFKELVSVSKV